MSNKKEKLTEIVGKGNVLDAPETLKAYSRDQSFVLPIKPSFVVKPKNAQEVEEIVRWANQSGTPLVPVSSGPPRFRGDTIPGAAEAVIVDLSGMKQIRRIDRRNRMVLIEPGVTFSQLQPELAKEGLRISAPLLPRSNKSVVTSLLEREPTLIPKVQWAVLDPLRCLEIVWGDGNKLTTGEAGSLGSLEEEWKMKFAQVSAAGPAQTSFYKFVSAAQGSMGIVTWASIKCEVRPKVHRLFFVPSPKVDDLIDFAFRLLRFRFGDELLLLNGPNIASILGDGADQIKALEAKVPAWVFMVGVAGRDVLPEERVAFQQKDIADIAKQYGLQLLTEIPGAREDEMLSARLNPSKEPYWKLARKGGCQDIFFLTTLNRVPEFVRAMVSLSEAYGYPTSDIGIYVQPVHQGSSCHCEFSLPYDPGNLKEAAKVRDFFARASEELLKQGAFFSRPYGMWAHMAYNRDAQTKVALQKIKGIFDPNHVMNPGKLCF